MPPRKPVAPSPILTLTTEELEALLASLPNKTPKEQAEIAALLEQADRENHLQKCRDDFLTFVKEMWPQFICGPHHERMAEMFQAMADDRERRVTISMPPRSGKALALGTEIPTPGGFVKIEDLRPGDYVFGGDGKPVAVVAVSEVFKNRPVYSVSMDDGCSVVADENHDWLIRPKASRPPRIMSTKELVDWIAPGHRRRPGLPLVAVEYEEADLPIDPYVLGAWLGDGTSVQNTMTQHPDDAVALRANFEARGYPTMDRKDKYCFGVGGGLWGNLKKLGLLGNKHIPEIYRYASIRQRTDLVRGMMDTDGHVTKTGHCIYATRSKKLSEGIMEVLRSLGVWCNTRSYETELNGKACLPTQNVFFHEPGFTSFPRKSARETNRRADRFRYIAVTPAGIADTLCIQVANPDGLFLAGRGYVLTHNSELTSYLFPAWFLGKFPDKKVLQVSHKADLAVGFGRKVRNLFSDPKFKEIFPGVSLKADNKAAGRWETNKGGTYYAAGVGASLAGFGGDLILLDDIHSDQDAPLAMFDPEIFNKVYSWYSSVPRQRIQPGAKIGIISTRWGERDIIGRLKLDEKERGADKWKSLDFPAITTDKDGVEHSYWPEFWPLEELRATKAAIIASGSAYKWNAQYQQHPTAEEGALLKKAWWNVWEHDFEPTCEFKIQVWDTANKATQRSNYSVCTTWGVFWPPDANAAHIILLDLFMDKLEFPDLKAEALKQYRKHEPDSLVIEGKNAGDSLIFELRKMGLYVENFTPTRGDGDKVARVNAITDIFASGVVWIMDKEWRATVEDQCVAFPMGTDDDIVDTVSMALARFRRGNFIRLDTDEEDEYEPNYFEKADYY